MGGFYPKTAIYRTESIVPNRTRRSLTFSFLWLFNSNKHIKFLPVKWILRLFAMSKVFFIALNTLALYIYINPILHQFFELIDTKFGSMVSIWSSQSFPNSISLSLSMNSWVWSSTKPASFCSAPGSWDGDVPSWEEAPGLCIVASQYVSSWWDTYGNLYNPGNALEGCIISEILMAVLESKVVKPSWHRL